MAGQYLFLFCIILGIADNEAFYDESSAFAQNCTTNPYYCEINVNPLSTCKAVNITTEDGSVQEQMRCFCNEEQGYFKEGDKCLYHARVGEQCGDTAKCIRANTHCVPDGSGGTALRCECTAGTAKVKLEGEYFCVTLITKQIDPSCSTCMNNEGKCYDRDGDDQMDGCICPASLSGQNCENVHVNVSCSTSIMSICYEAHPGVNFSANAWLYVEGHGDLTECVATPADAECGPGFYKLALPLVTDGVGTCGINKFYLDASLIKYQAQLVVDKDRESSEPGDEITFRTYCIYNAYMSASFNGISAKGLSGGEEGLTVQPGLTFYTVNNYGERVSSTLPMRDGDMVRFILNLDTSNGYYALRVESCTFSTYPTLGVPFADHLNVIHNSCPLEGQDIFTDKNNWRHLVDQPSHMETGLVPVRRMAVGNTIFFHCSIKLCLLGYADECSEVKCGIPSRRKRSESEKVKYIEVQRGITIQDADKPTIQPGAQVSEDVDNKKLFAATIAILLVIVIAGVSIGLYAYFRIRHKRQQNNDRALMLKKRPPKFALKQKHLSHMTQSTV